MTRNLAHPGYRITTDGMWPYVCVHLVSSCRVLANIFRIPEPDEPSNRLPLCIRTFRERRVESVEWAETIVRYWNK